jgi:hypothetical protein
MGRLQSEPATSELRCARVYSAKCALSWFRKEGNADKLLARCENPKMQRASASYGEAEPLLYAARFPVDAVRSITHHWQLATSFEASSDEQAWAWKDVSWSDGCFKIHNPSLLVM